MAATSIVILFNQITDTFIQTVHSKGWVDSDGVPTGVVNFYMSASPFNLQFTKDSKTSKASPKVAAFVDAVSKAGRAYCMPPYGDVLPAIAEHSLSKNSAIPFVMGVDDFVVNKSKEAWADVCEWLQTSGFPEARTVIDTGTEFTVKARVYIAEKGDSITEEAYRAELLVPLLGADWRERSENLSKFKFLRLFGASDALLDAFSKAVIVSRGKSVEIAHEARFVANFINLFKPTTAFKVGAVSDILNFTAMASGDLALRAPTDQDSLRILMEFDVKSPVLQNITAAYFDMEPDDVGVLTMVKRLLSGVSITRIYPSQELADAAEAYLAERIKFGHGDLILIDPLLGNSKALAQVYLSKK